MDQQQGILIPKKFYLQFRSQIEKEKSIPRTSQDNSQFHEIYINSFDLQKNKLLIQNKLAEIGVSEENSINLAINWLKDMHEFYSKFDELIQSQKLGDINDHDQQNLIDWKFQLFIHKKYLAQKLFNEFLDKNFDLEITDAPTLYLKLVQLNTINEFQTFNDKATPILMQTTDYDDKSAEIQKKVSQAFYNRNLCLKSIKATNIENLLQNNTLEICLDLLYGNIQKLNLQTFNPLQIAKETEQQFSTRLTAFLDSFSSKFQGWKISKKKQLVSSLFQQVPDYNYQKIVTILLQSKLQQFATKQLITDELLMKLFNLPSADFFKKDQISSELNNVGKKNQKLIKEEDTENLGKSSYQKFEPKNQSSFDKKKLHKQQEQKNLINSPSKINDLKEKEGRKSMQKEKVKQNSIKRLQKQIKIVYAQTRNKLCIQIILRQLQIALLQQDQKTINQKARNLRDLVNKYKLRTNCFTDIDEVEVEVKQFTDRLPKISTIRKKLYVINLIDVLEGKNYIENQRASMCKDANAILIIGRTGAGKSTLMTALAGFSLIYSPQTGDYRAENLQIGKEIPISNGQQSQTQWANVKKLCKIYSNGKDLIIIDTPGFQDNRGVEIQITNNIATVNLIKKLKSARILIVLPKEQFYGARQIQNYNQFIKLFSSYFFNVRDFQYSLNIVLTKGLTAKQLLKTIESIEITQTFRNIDWSTNEKNFQNILKRKLKDLRRQSEIVQPSKHPFDSLMEGVIQLKQKQSPGDDICESFSSTALQALQQTYNYLEKMVKETFQMGEFLMTSFYLNSIKQLDSIQKTNNYHQTKNFLKQEMQKKVKSFHSTFKKFLTSNNDEWLNDLKSLRQYFYNPQSEPFYKLLFYNQLTNTSEPNPKQIFDAEIQAKISAARLIFDSTQSMEKNKKIEVRSTLKMIKSFGFNLQYQQIINKITNSTVKIHKKLEDILDQIELDKQQWEKYVEMQINQFKENEDQNCSDIQKYLSIRKMVENYISQNNQLDQIMKLKDRAMTQCLDGKLKKICTQYLQKLNIIKETHYSIKQVVEPKFKQILNELDIIIASYEEKQTNQQTINLKDFDMWQNYNENRAQIYQIKTKFADSQVLQFNNVKQEESMLKLFFNNLLENIDNLQKIINGIPKNPEHIDPDKIQEKLQTIFGLLQAMQRKRQSSKGQEKQKDKKQQALKRTLEKSYKKINSIISTIQRSCSIELIRNYEINLKLMNSLTVILEFQEFKDCISDESMKNNLDNIQSSIIMKMQSPLKNIQNDPFTTLFSFEKLWKTLHYMKKLDDQTRLLGGKAIHFRYSVDFSQNPRIKNTVIKSLQKIKQDYDRLKPIRQLSTYGIKSSIKSTTQLQLQKKEHIENLQYELLENAINYIKSYKFVKTINDDFSEDLTIIEDFKRQFLQKLDLKAIVKSRIQSINTQLSKNLALDYLRQIGQQFNFFNKIHQNTKTPQELEYIDIENKIFQKLKNYGKSFDCLYDQACELYQDVENKGQGVDYSTLQNLLDNPGRNVEEGEQKLKKLLFRIDQKYEKILTNYYIQQNPDGKVSNNANIFLNIIEFKKICQKTTYKCKLQENLHKSGLQNLFSQVTNGFQALLEDIKKGKGINELQKQNLIRYEKRIALLLKEEYDEFKKNKGITQNYFVSFEKRKKQIREKVVGLYSKKETLVFDQNFLQVYQSTSPQIRQSIRRVAISKNKDEVEQKKNLIECNHEELIKFYSSKVQQGKNMPQQVFQSLMSELKPLVNQITEIQEDNKKTVQEAVQKKVPTQIILCFLKGDSLNNQVIRKTAVEAVKKYFQEQQKTINFNDLQNLNENIQRNLTITTNNDFKIAAQKNMEFNKASSKYVNTVKSKFQDRTRIYEKEVNDFRDFIRKRKLGQSFQLSNTKLKPQQYQVLEKGVQTYKIFSKHSQSFVQEIDNFKKVVSQRVKQGNKELKESALKLDNIKRQIVEKKVNNPQSLISTLEQVHSKRLLCGAYGQVFNRMDNLETKVQQQVINCYDTLLNDIKVDMKRKYDDAMNWNLEKYINNQMIVCNSKENEQNQIVLSLVDSFMPVFFEKESFSAAFSKKIQQNTEREFKDFEKSVLDDIDNYFIASIQCSSEKVMKYYKLLSKIKESPSIHFSENIKFDNKVRDKLLTKFKSNAHQIISFIEKPQKLASYHSFLDKLKRIEQHQKNVIEELKKKSDSNIRDQCRQIQQKIDSQKSTVTAQDPDRDTKLANLDNQSKADKLSKQNDLNKLLSNNIENVKKQNTKAKQQIIDDLNSYLTNQIVNPLIIFQRAVTYFYCQKEIKQSVYSIPNFFKQIQDKYKKTIFRYIYTILKNIDNQHAQSLTNQKCFESITQSNWRDLVSGSTFETLMKQVPHLQDISKKQRFFDDRFKKFQEIYSQLTETYKKAYDFNQTKKKLVQDTKIMGQKISETYKSNQTCKHQRWELLSRIAAIWTIHKSQFNDDNCVQFIHKPHPGQILATFLLLQFDEKPITNILKNTMVQVSTGEGKSVILGILSTYLALVGFKVYEACYSNYLSQRDYSDFAELFNLFGVQDKIFYRTFPQTCRMMLEESPDKPFIGKIQKLLINPSIWTNIGSFLSDIFPGSKQGKKILLIDEADAFLDENFLGECFFPSINIKKKSVQNLLDFVWNYREKLYELTPERIVKSNQFDILCKELSNKQFRSLMQNQAHAMVRDLGNYTKDVYSLINGEIYYKTGDSLTNKIHYGYRTVFNYYHEFYVNKRISKDQFQKHVSINLIIASFSYSKLPSYFSSILGVTGTLDCMSEKQKKILTDRFGVKRTFVQPSIYPSNRRILQFFKCSEDKLFQQIAKSIENQHKNKRPIVVFFQSKNKVYDFYNSPQFSTFKSNATIVTHQVSDEDRKFRIQTSTADYKITLLTVDFSRGTDFKLNVKNAEKHPGLHVICAFIPNSFSDYLQVVGRTGRQGKNGTVNFYFVDFTLTDSQVNQLKRQDAEQMIRKLDNDHWNKKYKQLIERMNKADNQHDISTALYSKGSSADKIFKQMQIFNLQYPIVNIVSRTVIGLDATCSMNELFQKLISVIQTSLPSIRQVIQDAKVMASFQIKFVIYRNYNSKSEDLLAYSNFQNKTQTLAEWLKEIQVSGGWGNQALEVCLQHINSLQNVNQYVIISDAKGNLPDEVMLKRQKYHGHAYFEGKGFPFSTVGQQIEKLAKRDIKGHFYYLNPITTSQYYKKVAQKTGGVAQQFPIDDKNSSKIFGDFIAERILQNIDSLLGDKGGQNLVQRYKARSQ